MGPEAVVLSVPAIRQTLGLGYGCEQLGVEQLILEAAVERFGKAVLPLGTRLDVGRVGAAAPTPAPQKAWAMNSRPLPLLMNAGAG